MREAFRQSLRHAAYQREAFERATALLQRHKPRLSGAEARLLVARMLATEPLQDETPGDTAIPTFPSARLPAA